MEILIAGILALAAYTATNSPKPATQPSDMQTCANICESGVVAEYKWCKCQTKALWEKSNEQ